jgi:hypothetical protein
MSRLRRRPGRDLVKTAHDLADRFAPLRRKVRLVMLLSAAEAAGLVPIKILRLHALAYLSNVLAPVWDMPTLDGRVLKRRGGPFYPGLQGDLDRLVGLGLITITNLGHVRDDDGRWRLEGSYGLNHKFARDVLHALSTFDDHRRVLEFIRELAYGLSALSDDDFDLAIGEDATYADALVTVGNVVDFAEWKRINFSANAADYFERLIPGGSPSSPGEKVHLYIRHLHRRIHAGR